jgi:hypothetical protein
MTLYQFQSLDIQEQANAVWDGTYLEHRTNNGFRIVLYDLGGFYVEVYYAPDENKIIKLRPFKSTSPLQPYLDRMNSDELKKLC